VPANCQDAPDYDRIMDLFRTQQNSNKAIYRL